MIGLFRTGRSGSTLLCQMFNKLPNTLVLADTLPYAYVVVAYLSGFILRGEAVALVKNIIRLQGKPLKKVFLKIHFMRFFKIELYSFQAHTRMVIKFMGAATLFVNDIHMMYPKMELLFIIRHLKGCLNSWYKMCTKGSLYSAYYKYSF